MGVEPFDGFELTLLPENQDGVGSFFEPDSESLSVAPTSWLFVQYSVRTGFFWLHERGLVTTGTAFNTTEAVQRFYEAVELIEPSIGAGAAEITAMKLMATPANLTARRALPPSVVGSGWATKWRPYAYGKAVFGASLIALTVPVLIVARRVA